MCQDIGSGANVITSYHCTLKFAEIKQTPNQRKRPVVSLKENDSVYR